MGDSDSPAGTLALMILKTLNPRSRFVSPREESL